MSLSRGQAWAARMHVVTSSTYAYGGTAEGGGHARWEEAQGRCGALFTVREEASLSIDRAVLMIFRRVFHVS